MTGTFSIISFIIIVHKKVNIQSQKKINIQSQRGAE